MSSWVNSRPMINAATFWNFTPHSGVMYSLKFLPGAARCVIKKCLTATSLGVLTFTFTQSSWVAGGIFHKEKPFRKHACQHFGEGADKRVKVVKEKWMCEAWTEERRMEDNWKDMELEEVRRKHMHREKRAELLKCIFSFNDTRGR